MRKPRGESQRGTSDAARAALAEIHARARARRESLVDKIVAEIERRQNTVGMHGDLLYSECVAVTGASLNTVKAAVRESPRVEEVTTFDDKRKFVTLSY